MNRFRVAIILCLAASVGTRSAVAAEVKLDAAHRIAAGAPEWSDLAAAFAHRADTAADFEERRFFPFKNEPVILKGEVRVSAERGLSLHYVTPDERVVILDRQGMLTRELSGQTTPPADPRAGAMNDALLHILRFDFSALAVSFELYGQRDGASWSLGLVPRAPALRRAIGDIFVEGEADTVRRIELRRTAKQHIDIVMSAPRPPAAFTADEVKRFFR